MVHMLDAEGRPLVRPRIPDLCPMLINKFTLKQNEVT